jgi:hypothetical protein
MVNPFVAIQRPWARRAAVKVLRAVRFAQLGDKAARHPVPGAGGAGLVLVALMG